MMILDDNIRRGYDRVKSSIGRSYDRVKSSIGRSYDKLEGVTVSVRL